LRFEADPTLSPIPSAIAQRVTQAATCKVVRTALTNAGSIASLMLTTAALVADLPEEDNRAQVPGGRRSMH